jgi:predicted dehydrogenase
VRRLRIAVVGAGHLGRIHARLLQGHPGIELIGVVDPVVEAREKIAAELGVATFAHHDELPDHVEGAIVVTSTAFHHAVACSLLKRGIHLFVEKPLTTSVSLADEMIALAGQKGLVLQAGHVERFNPAWRAAARYLHRPRFIEGVRTSGYTFRSTDIGVVLDLMIHDLDLVLATVRSELVAVEAVGSTLFGPFEDMAHAHLRFANGCVAQLTASRTSFQSQRTMQVMTERAYIGIDFATSSAKLIRPSKELLRGELNVHDLSADQKTHLKNNLFHELLPIQEIPVTPSNAIEQEQREFVECVVHGRVPTVSAEHARECLVVAERIVKSIDDSMPGKGRRRASSSTAQLLTSPHWHHDTPRSPTSNQRKAS